MFAITVEQKQYKTYILSDKTAGSQLEVVPERGGIITLWRIKGQEILYLDVERFAERQLSVRGGIPILFPICGNLPDNTYTYKGQQYTLKQHGFARDLPWEVTDQATQDKASLTISLKSNEQTRVVYPFDFKLDFTYKIYGNTLEIEQKYTNLSAEPMPFSTGFHPYFLTNDKTQLEFEIPSTEYQDQITKEIHPFHGKFDYNSDVIDVGFKQLSGDSASVTDTSRKLKLKIEYDDLFATLVFWTVKGKEFYCLEPWSAPRNSLNTKEHLSVLPPNATLSAKFSCSTNFL